MCTVPHHLMIQVRNEGERVVIGRVVKGGAAERSGNLHPGGREDDCDDYDDDDYDYEVEEIRVKAAHNNTIVLSTPPLRRGSRGERAEALWEISSRHLLHPMPGIMVIIIITIIITNNHYHRHCNCQVYTS